MTDAVLVAVLSCAGTLFGTIGGIIAAQKLVNFRLQELEKKVEKHNNLVERMVEVEARTKGNTRRIEALENKTEHLSDQIVEVKSND